MKKLLIFLLLISMTCTSCVSDYIYERWPRNIVFNYVKAVCGRPIGQYYVSWYWNDHGNYERAFKWCYRSAEQGLSTAHFSLGYKYEFGRGVEKDIQKALYWYNIAAEQEEPSALYRLGVLYQIGKYVPKDEEKGMSLIRRAAELGSEEAIDRLKAIEEWEKWEEWDKEHNNDDSLQPLEQPILNFNIC